MPEVWLQMVMTMRLFLMNSPGFNLQSPDIYYFPEFYTHPFRDVTDSPAPTIVGGPVNLAILSSDYVRAKEQYRNSEPYWNVSMSNHSKPIYSIPSMKEIASSPRNGLKVISTFSGCGGSSLGYKMAGCTVVWANEFIEAAREVYSLNHQGTILDARDIREIKPEDILDSCKMKSGELDILDGSPPCASFSTSGKRQSGWGKVRKYSDTMQRTDDLFYEYIRIVNGLQPKVFIAENVSGLVNGAAKGYFLDILKKLKSCGYRVEARVLDAQWLGVPQSRRRLFFVGVRNDLQKDPCFPSPLSYRYSVTDAIHDIIEHQMPGIDISRYAIGREYHNTEKGNPSEKFFNLKRSHEDLPVKTITASGGGESIASVVHPSICRKFSIDELKRICSFPDDFILTGTYQKQWERLGRAVPPMMMFHLVKSITAGVFDVRHSGIDGRTN